MNQEKSIKCPNCGERIDVQEIVYHQIEQKIYQENLESKKQFETEIAQKRKEYQQAFEALQVEKESLQEKVQQATKESCSLPGSTLSKLFPLSVGKFIPRCFCLKMEEIHH